MLIDIRAGETKILEVSLTVRVRSITQGLGRFPDTGRLGQFGDGLGLLGGLQGDLGLEGR
jgi:hypothetical protein